MGLQYPNALHAAGSMGATTVVWQAGCKLAKSATGVYTATLDENVDAAECACLVTLRAASGIVRVAQTSDSVKTIETFNVDGTTAADKAFDLLIIRAPSA